MSVSPTSPDARQPDDSLLQQPFGLFEALLQAQSDLGEGVVIVEEGRIRYANEAFAQLCGFSNDELTLESVLALVLPEDRARLMRRSEDRGSEMSHRYVLAIRHPDGGVRNLEAAVKFTQAQGRRLVFALVRDVTERTRLHEQLKESERRFRQLTEATFEAITLSEDGVVLDINPAHTRLFGYEPPEIVGRPGFHLTVPETQGEVRRRVLAANDQPYQVLCQRKDGTTFMGEVRTGSCLVQGRVIRVSAIRDVTQRLQVEKLKNEFLSVVSHELRTPLTSIRGSLGLLASGRLGELPPKADHLIGIAANNADRLVRLVNDLLDVERMDAGQDTLICSEVDLAIVMAQALEGVRPLADRAGIRLEVASVEGTIRADADRLVQLLTNLLSNAIKFSPAGTSVRLSLERRADEWWLSVADQGRGIPADKLESIFGRFQQVDTSDSRQKGGTGLGLAICRNIARQHGGRIWAESMPGVGSTFIVALPAGRPAEEETTGA